MEKLKFKFSSKHLAIFETISKKGYYKPVYSDQEPALKTLENLGFIEWKPDFTGVVFTEYGKNYVKHYNIVYFHTKGRWKLQGPKKHEESGQVYYSILTDFPDIRNGSYAMPGFYYPHSIQRPEEMEANANIIGAGSQLYIALLASQSLISSLVGADDPDSHIFDVLSLVNSAIKDAKGGQNG